MVKVKVYSLCVVCVVYHSYSFKLCVYPQLNIDRYTLSLGGASSMGIHKSDGEGCGQKKEIGRPLSRWVWKS